MTGFEIAFVALKTILWLAGHIGIFWIFTSWILSTNVTVANTRTLLHLFIANVAMVTLDVLVFFPHWFPMLLISGCKLVYFGRFSVRSVDIAHEAVVTFFGSRTGLFVGEGQNGIGPRPFFDIQEVDKRQTTLLVQGGVYVSNDSINITVRAFPIIWQTVDSSKVLELGVKHIEEFVSEVAARSARAFVATLPAVGDVSNTNDTNTVIHQGDRMRTEIRDAVNAAAESNGWGIKVKTVAIPELLLPVVITDAASRVVKERLEQQAELIEAEHVVQLILHYMTVGGMSLLDATRLAQSERDKMIRNVVEVDGANPLERFGGTVFAGQTSNGKNKGGQ